MFRIKIWLLVIPFLFTLVSGCAVNNSNGKQTGYLSNYQHLKTENNVLGFIQDRWINPELSAKQNPIEPTSFYIKPTVYFPTFDHENEFMRNNADKILSYLTIKTRQTVQKYFPLVDRPTRGTFIIEPAITQVKVSKNNFYPQALFPVGSALTLGQHLVANSRNKFVELRMENRVTISGDEALLAEIVLRGKGEHLKGNSERLSIKHIKPILDAWIAQWDQNLAHYRQIIDIRHGSSASSTNAELAK